MSSPKVLLIDDSSAECLFIGGVLRKAGCDLQIAGDGRRGLIQALSLRPHCLIVDIFLPDINGYEICRRIRKVDGQHTIPIILMSTNNTELDRSYGLQLGADGYLTKPFNAEDLVRAVWNVLPRSYRSSVPTLIQPQKVGLDNLIPRRCESSELFTTSNPFAPSQHLDRSTQRFLAEIDGRKTVSRLCKESVFDTPDVVLMLKRLFEQRLIEFYDQDGHLFENPPFKMY
jgi:CheY-like chemotaxis protein